MYTALTDWEGDFQQKIQQINPGERNKAGALLRVIPTHEAWEGFLTAVKSDWKNWKNNLQQHPSCLILLYCGLAFFEYDDNTFWPLFIKSVGSNPLPANQQADINRVFAKAAKEFGLELRLRNHGTDYVGSAIYYIGIPLSLWDGFLDICEWALWQRDWEGLTDEEWKNTIEKRAGGRQRLKKFLNDNRESAIAFVREMLDAREIFARDHSQTINDIAQISILRYEYFDEVPETAEFLRPQNPDSLFKDRARLIWNEQRQHISLQLPSVPQNKLPATWRVGTLSQYAAQSPDEIPINAEAFCNPLHLTLESENRSETQWVRGIAPWGLFDMESGCRLINPDRDEFPLKSYVLVAQKEIEFLSREGFDEDENPINEPFALADGTPCFLTRLWPTGKYAEIKLRDKDNKARIIRFRPRPKIDAMLFFGKGCQAAYFDRSIDEDRIKIDHLPILCVAIPNGYFKDNNAEVGEKFKVSMDGNPTRGQWERKESPSGDRRDYFFWKWDAKPFGIKLKQGKTLSSLKALNEIVVSPEMEDKGTLRIESENFKKTYNIYLGDSKPDMENCWKDLPGASLPLFLLCQEPEGMKWDDLMFAMDVIAPNLRLYHDTLRKYADHGILLQQNHRWKIGESRNEIKWVNRNSFQLNYCGDPSILWGLYHHMYHARQGATLPVIEVKDNKDEVPYLQMEWPKKSYNRLEKYLKHHGGVKRCPILQTH